MVFARQPVMRARQPEYRSKAALAAARIVKPHTALIDASTLVLAITGP
ncbi:hypothetical protein [Streptomyces sp. NPDC044948]